MSDMIFKRYDNLNMSITRFLINVSTYLDIKNRIIRMSDVIDVNGNISNDSFDITNYELVEAETINELIDNIYLYIDNNVYSNDFINKYRSNDNTANNIFKSVGNQVQDLSSRIIHHSRTLYLFDNVIFESKETCPDIDYYEKIIINYYQDVLSKECFDINDDEMIIDSFGSQLTSSLF